MKVEDTGKERDGSGGYEEGEGWKQRIQGGRVRNVEETGKESEECGRYGEGE